MFYCIISKLIIKILQTSTCPVADSGCNIFEDLAEEVRLEGDNLRHNHGPDAHIDMMAGSASLMHLIGSHNPGRT